LNRYRLFVDIDAGCRWIWKLKDPLWDDLYPLVKMEAKRLADLYPVGDRATIHRSDNGWHIQFNKASLTKEEEQALMTSSLGHMGHIIFSLKVGDTAIRWSEQPVKGSHKPLLREVMKFG
jgi:hypothetical protein